MHNNMNKDDFDDADGFAGYIPDLIAAAIVAATTGGLLALYYVATVA